MQLQLLPNNTLETVKYSNFNENNKQTNEQKTGHDKGISEDKLSSQQRSLEV